MLLSILRMDKPGGIALGTVGRGAEKSLVFRRLQIASCYVIYYLPLLSNVP